MRLSGNMSYMYICYNKFQVEELFTQMGSEQCAKRVYECFSRLKWMFKQAPRLCLFYV